MSHQQQQQLQHAAHSALRYAGIGGAPSVLAYQQQAQVTDDGGGALHLHQAGLGANSTSPGFVFTPAAATLGTAQDHAPDEDDHAAHAAQHHSSAMGLAHHASSHLMAGGGGVPFFPPQVAASSGPANNAPNASHMLGQAMLASILYAQLSSVGASAAGAAASSAGRPVEPATNQLNPHAIWQHWAASAAAGVMPSSAPTGLLPQSTSMLAAPAASAPSIPLHSSPASELDSLRTYQHRASAMSQFEKHFKELPFAMQVEAIKNPPSFIGPAELLRALISLPIQTQAAIIKKLPLATQKAMIRALTPREKKRLLDVLSGKPVLFDEDPSDEFCVVPTAYIERAGRIAREEGFSTELLSDSRTRHSASAAAATSSPFPMATPASNGTNASSGLTNPTSLDDFGLASSGVLPSTRIDVASSRRPETSFLAVIQKMMFSFGDIHYAEDAAGAATGMLAWPSLYAAMRISDHVSEFLHSILSHMPRKLGLAHLLRLFPLQARVYLKWKRMNRLSKQEQTSKLKSDPLADSMGPTNDTDSEDEAPTKQRSLRLAPGASRKRKGAAKPAAAAASAPKRGGKKDTATKEKPPRKKRKVAGAGSADASDSDFDGSSTAPTKRKRAAPVVGGKRPTKTKKPAPRGGESSSESDEAMARSSSSSGSDSEYSYVESSANEESSEEDEGADEDQDVHPDVRMAADAGNEEEDPELAEVDSILGSAPVPGAATATKQADGKAAADSTPASAATASSSANVAYDLHLELLDLHLGPVHRLSRQDALSSHMPAAHYRSFVKSREASFVSPPRVRRSFISWLQIPTWVDKSSLMLLGFLAWDRIGMIVECCARLRECSRHARSELPFTVYEVNKAITVLETVPALKADPTSVNQEAIELTAHAFAHARKKSATSNGEVTDATIAQPRTPFEREMLNSQQLQHLVPPVTPIAAAPVFNVASIAAAVAAATAATSAVAVPATPVAVNPFHATPVTVSAAYLAPTPAAAPAVLDSPLHLVSSLSSIPVMVPSLLPATVPLSTMPTVKGRFSDAARHRLQIMAEDCQWKYRRGNPAIQAIHREEKLEFDQIRGWMANNKPPVYKRAKN